MAHLQRSSATLRLSGEDLDPDEVTALLGSQPTYSQRKGQEFPSKSPSGKRVAKTGQWRLAATDTEPENLDAQVSEILSKLADNDDLWQKLARRFEVDLFCGWFMGCTNEGAIVSARTLRALGTRGINLSIDLYAPNGDASQETHSK